MVYDEETLKRLSQAYDEALSSPHAKIKGALFGKPPFKVVEGDGLKKAKQILIEAHGYVKTLIEMTKPYKGVPADIAKQLLSCIDNEMTKLDIGIKEVDRGDFVTLTREILTGVEKAILVHPCGFLDRLLSRVSALLCIYLNN